ncbi:MAG: phosphodiester glycosidase family protein [Tannerellaceae bacterium]|jgi:hypothetical protein|nr:phosphodiester glycosidase family protein [Tannerellaceae bacterium]
MKKSFILFFSIVISHSELSAQMSDWGQSDTISHHTVGPGIFFTELLYPEKPLAIYVITVDLNNPNNTVESYQSNNKVPDRIGESVLQQCQANSYENHRSVMGINHDFYDINGGVAIGTNIRNGEMSHNGEWHDGTLINRSVLTIDTAKRANVLQPAYFTDIRFSNNTRLPIEMINDRADELHSMTTPKNVVLYNRYNGKTLTATGKYIKIRALDKWKFNSSPIRCEVIDIQEKPIQPDQDNYVIRLSGKAVEIFMENAATGDTIYIEQMIRAVGWGAHTNDIIQAFHGYPSIIRRGTLHEGEYNRFDNSTMYPNGRAYEVAPHTMAGMSRDGKMLFFVVVDGRRNGWSIGLNCIETALFMVKLGAYHVINFDGGGSSTMVINETVRNKPSDTAGERNVLNTLQVLSTAPIDHTVQSVSFKRPRISLPEKTSVQLDFFIYNRYDDIIAANSPEGISFKQTNTLNGTISPSGLFTAGEANRSGYVIATVGRHSDSIWIDVGKESDVAISKIVNSNIGKLICVPTLIKEEALISFNVATPSHITISLINMAGIEIEHLVDRFCDKGQFEQRFLRNTHPPGIYLLRLISRSGTQTIKIILL